MVVEDKDRAAYIPNDYYIDFLKIIQSQPALFEIVTYGDFDWSGDYDWKNGYPTERENWKRISASRPKKDKITILLQHDVDSSPMKSWECVRQEMALGIRSNVMLFNRRVNRRKYEASGILEYTPYPVDWDLLGEAERKGFCVCYHANAWDQALFDRDKAHEIFREDVGALREKIKIEYFSAHGGLRSPEGLTNNCLEAPPELQSNLRWVHNGASPRFDAQWSDGGINSTTRDPAARDLRDFVLKMLPGKRYRILTHPQYYGDLPNPEKCRLWEAEWFREMVSSYDAGRGGEVWRDVKKHFTSMRRQIRQKAFKSKLRHVGAKLGIIKQRA